MNNEKNIEPTGEEVIIGELENEDDISEDSLGEENDVEEGEDAFDELYDDEENADEAGDDEPAESDEEPESTVPDERDAQLRAALEKNENIGAIANIILKELGESASGDAEEALIKVAAEATGKSTDDIKRQLASNKAFEAQAAEDIKAIHAAFPEARKYKSLHELPNKLEFGRLMDAGKSVKQAFMMSHPDIAERQLDTPGKKNNLAGTKSHITSSVPKGAKDTSVNISKAEMARLRETFGDDMSDADIKALYRKVSK